MSGLIQSWGRAQDMLCAKQPASQLSPHLRNFYMAQVDDYTKPTFAGNASYRNLRFKFKVIVDMQINVHTAGTTAYLLLRTEFNAD